MKIKNIQRIILTIGFSLFLNGNSIAQPVHEDSIKLIFTSVAQNVDDSIQIKIIKKEYENIFDYQVDQVKLSALQEQLIEKLRDYYRTEYKDLVNKYFMKTTVMELKNDFLKTD